MKAGRLPLFCDTALPVRIERAETRPGHDSHAEPLAEEVTLRVFDARTKHHSGLIPAKTSTVRDVVLHDHAHPMRDSSEMPPR